MLEPRSGRFWRQLSPGDDVQAAADACPEGGCILLRPGIFDLVPHVHEVFDKRVGLSITTSVNLFGRGQATVQSHGSVCTLDIYYTGSNLFAVDGLTVQFMQSTRRQSVSAAVSTISAAMYGGFSRLQSCVITGPSYCGLRCMATAATAAAAALCPQVVINCRYGERICWPRRRRATLKMCLSHSYARISGSNLDGVHVTSTSSRIIGNEIFGNVRGISVSRQGDPHISGNTIRDHAGVTGVGVVVHGSAHGRATILPDNVFLRNDGGDVVRDPPIEDD